MSRSDFDPFRAPSGTDPKDYGRVPAIKYIRACLGIGLREAHDFYMRTPATWHERLTEAQQSTKGSYVSTEDKIRQVIHDYYLTLDQQLGGVDGPFALKAFGDIQAILGMTWFQGQETARRQGK